MPNPIENVIAKGRGMVGAVEARAKGLKGVFVKLAEQHREAAALLSRAESATDTEKRRDLWREIKKQLVSHERAELSEIYPMLSAYDTTRDIVARHGQEAQVLESTIRQIDAMTFDTPAWKTSIERLTALVKQHVEEEEGDFFPRAQEAIGDEAAKQLEEPFMRAKQREMNAIS
jgi:hemerythrin superfamily protein